MSITPTDSTELDRAGMPVGTPAQTGAAALNKAASRPRPTAESQTDQPSTTDKLIDTMITKMAGEIARPEAPPPPPPQFSVSQRIGMQILAAADPEFYKSAIIPMLQGQQTTMENYRQRVDGMRGDKEKAFNTMLALAQRRDAQKEMAASRQAREDIAQQNTDLREQWDKARMDEVEASRKQKDTDQAVADNTVSNVAGGVTTMFPNIQKFAESGSEDDQSGMALMAEAQALQGRLAEIGQSGESVNPEAAKQLHQEYMELNRNYLYAAASRAQRAAAKAGRDASLSKGTPRTKLPVADARALSEHSTYVQGFADTLNYLNQNAKNIGHVKLSDYKRGPLGNAFMNNFRASYSTNIMAPRHKYTGSAYSQVEAVSGKWSFAQDVNDMFADELRSGLESLVSASSREYLSILDGMEADGLDVEGRYDVYAKRIRPALRSIHAGFIETPPGVPVGTEVTKLGSDGVPIIRLPGEDSERKWVPDDPSEALYVARLMKWEGRKAGEIEDNLLKMGRDASEVFNVLTTLHLIKPVGEGK